MTNPMTLQSDLPRVGVFCECSGRVREALRRRGMEAWSIDTQPAEDGSPFHIQGDALEYVGAGWEAAVFHPECTFLSNSGVQWLDPKLTSTPTVPKGLDRWAAMVEAARFYRALRDSDIAIKYIENPVMNPWAAAMVKPGPRQIVQPHHFGDPFFKATGFEIINGEPLVRTHWMVLPEKGTEAHKDWSACHREPPGPNRKRNRSRTYPGIAEALADAVVRSLSRNVMERAA